MPPTSHNATSPRFRPDDNPSDEALLRGLGRGDPGAGITFVRRYQGRVYGLARSIVGDPSQAEDIAQEALIRAWRHAGSYESRRGSVSTWVLTMTRNLAVDALRRKCAQPADPRALIFLDQPAHGSMPEEAATVADETHRVRTALSELPGEQRRALVLAAFYGFTAREISQTEAIPLGTAKSRVRLGLMKARSASGRGQDTERKEIRTIASDDWVVCIPDYTQPMKGTLMTYKPSTGRGVVAGSVKLRHTVLALVGAVFAVLLGSSAAFASPGTTHFHFTAPNISGGSGAVALMGGGEFNATSGVVHADGSFRCTATVSSGPLTGCLAGQGAHWNVANALRSTPFKCTATDPAGVKTATISPDTAVLRVNFFRAGDRSTASFTANVIVSTNDIAPDVPGTQNAWIQGVGCGSARAHFNG